MASLRRPRRGLSAARQLQPEHRERAGRSVPARAAGHRDRPRRPMERRRRAIRRGRRSTSRADLGELTIGGNRMLDPARRLPRRHRPARLAASRGELSFTSASQPFVVNNQPVGDGRMSWLFVPRLHADRVAAHRRPRAPLRRRHRLSRPQLGPVPVGRRLRLGVGAPSCPSDPDEPWSLVFLRMTDRRRLRYLSQALYVWHHDEPAAIFRHAAVDGPDIRCARTARRTAPCRHRCGCCSTVRCRAYRSASTVTAAPGRRHAHGSSSGHSPTRDSPSPASCRLDRSTVLCESSGTARVTGSINGRRIDFVGTGVFEFLHG